jgi:hypothetical protein
VRAFLHEVRMHRSSNPARIATNSALWRTSSQSSRVAGGAIHAPGSRPIRSRSARVRGIASLLFAPLLLVHAHAERVRQVTSAPASWSA